MPVSWTAGASGAPEAQGAPLDRHGGEGGDHQETNRLEHGSITKELAHRDHQRVDDLGEKTRLVGEQMERLPCRLHLEGAQAGRQAAMKRRGPIGGRLQPSPLEDLGDEDVQRFALGRQESCTYGVRERRLERGGSPPRVRASMETDMLEVGVSVHLSKCSERKADAPRGRSCA